MFFINLRGAHTLYAWCHAIPVLETIKGGMTSSMATSRATYTLMLRTRSFAASWLIVARNRSKDNWLVADENSSSLILKCLM